MMIIITSGQSHCLIYDTELLHIKTQENIVGTSKSILYLVMAALCNRCGHYIFAL